MSGDYRGKGRVVFLAAIMVLSVFAMGAAFTGSAAAQDVEVSGGDDELQTAIENANQSDVIEVTDDSTYNQIVINRDDDASDLTIRAADSASPTISHDANDGTPAVAIDQDGITLEGFTVERTNTNNVAQAVRVTGDSVSLTDNTYELDGSSNNAAISVLTDSSGAADNPDVKNVTISDVSISGGEIITNDASQSGVLVADSGGASIDTGAVSVSGVTFTANADSNHVLELSTGGDVVDTAAVLSDNSFSTAAEPDATAGTINNFDIDGLVASTIQDAVDNASSESTVTVEDGTYDSASFPITVEESVDIKAAAEADPVVNASGESAWTAISVEADDVLLEGLTVKNTGNGDESERVRGIHGNFDSSGLIIRDTIVDGVSVEAGSNRPVAYGMTLNANSTTVENSEVKNVDAPNFAAGIRMGGDNNRVVSNGTIEDVTINSVGTDSTAEAAGIYLVSIENSQQTTVEDSSVSGVTVSDSSGSGAAGIALDSQTSDASNPSISVTQNSITDLSFSDADGVGLIVEDSNITDLSDVEVNQNDLSGNDNGTANQDTDATLDATSNWWGSADGPGDDGPGSGADVSSNVDFDPFYQNPDRTVLSDTNNLSVGTISTDHNFTGVVADEENLTINASDINADGYTIDNGTVDIQIISAGGNTLENSSVAVDDGIAVASISTEEFDPETNTSAPAEIVVEEAGDNGMNGSVELVHEAKTIDEGYNLTSVPQPADVVLEDVDDIATWNSTTADYDRVDDLEFDDSTDLHRGIWLEGGSDQARIGFDYDTSGRTSPGLVELNTGWHLASSNFDVSGSENKNIETDITPVLDEPTGISIFAGNQGQLLQKGDDTIGEYDAYWVFVDGTAEGTTRSTLTPKYDPSDRASTIGEYSDMQVNTN